MAALLAGLTTGQGLLVAQVSPSVPESRSREEQDRELLDAWDSVAQRIKNHEPWEALATDLYIAIEKNQHSEYVGRCQQLLTSIDAVIKSPPPKDNIDVETDTANLIAALPRSTMFHRLVIVPTAYYESIEQFAWDYYSKVTVSFHPDPAMILFGRGAAVIDELVECLDDTRVTRSVGTRGDDGYQRPIVARVCDVALSLIEGLSGCNFRKGGYSEALISEWSSDDRARLIRSVRKWRAATVSMGPSEAIIWQIENSPEELRISMIDTLIARGENELALSYLQKAYGQTTRERLESSSEQLALFHHWMTLRRFDIAVEHLQIAYDQAKYANSFVNKSQVANRMLRAGSRKPLDHYHRLFAEGERLERDMVTLIANFGETRDFQLLVSVVHQAAHRNDRVSDSMIQMIVESMRAAKDHRARMAVPIQIAVIDAMRDEWTDLLATPAPRHAFPPILDMAIYAIQKATGLGFGMNEDSDTYDRARACKAIMAWWEAEGEGAYGLEQNKPHAPVGIR